MNKKIFGRKLSRSRPAREALFSSLIRGMILSGKMVTTRAKAKAIQGDLEHIVTLSKKADLISRRKILAYLDNDKNTVKILFKQIAPAFITKSSGFTRVINLPARKGDNAKMVRVEWTEGVDYGKQSTANSKMKKPEEKSSKKTKKM